MANKLAHLVQGSGPVWIWIHGWGMNKLVWEPVAKQVSDFATVVTLDLPGFGESEWQTNNDDFRTMVARVDNFLGTIAKSYPGAKLNLMGWSMGGLVATALVEKKPDRYAQLVWVASSPCFLRHENWKGIEPKVLAAFQQQLAQDFRATTERFLAVQAMGSPNARKDIMALKEILQQSRAPHPEALAAGLRWLAKVDLRQTFSHLSLPTTRIYGKRDSLVPWAQSAQITKPHDDVVLFEDSAHTPFLNEQEKFVALLRSLTH
ncbi:MAG: pimeloyl-[acyl-carrier protein] methyl ester esterase BioH [Idiomarinaceae bacterium HL-53]|nr:MAG: pimeloyl-[acyl-carrier protein] methyl ester esterase BioH [Idiomarinaceae bacterium HL-53]CUS47604.1 pimeloyl-[acyl-carrier protein] methyl ester esterase [Idiomarinaceae bacterium HL-53]